MIMTAVLRTSCIILVLTLVHGCGRTPGDTPAGLQVADTATASPRAPADGPQVIPMADGGRMEGDLVQGVRSGPWTSHFPDGTVRSRVTYRNGKEEGPTEVFHANGIPYYTGQYHQGLTVGEWVFHDPTGRPVKRVTYDSTGVVQR